MFIEITKSKGDRVIVNLARILFCYEYRGKMTIELDDGTPIETVYGRDELIALFHRSGVAYGFQ